MSFSLQVKQELCAVEPYALCCANAQNYGLLLFGRDFSINGVSLLTDHACVAQAYENAIRESVGVKIRSRVTPAEKYIIGAATSVGRRRILEHFFAEDSENCKRINRANLLNESSDEMNCCYAAFLRGAFLSCGTISDPNKNYHLEFDVTYQHLSEDLVKICSEVGLCAKVAVRRGRYVVYFKDSENIEDLLTLMGAMNASLELMQIKIVKSVRNKVNRQNNFTTANISRTADAAAHQLEAIETIIRYNALETLAPELKTVALLRRDNYDLSLTELGQQLNPPISRSGVNHRLAKLMKIAKQLEQDAERLEYSGNE